MADPTALVHAARERFVAASTPGEYLTAREEAHTAYVVAREAGAADLAAQALLTGAECCWFAADALGVDPTSDDTGLLRSGLADATAAGIQLSTTSPGQLVETWASLASHLLDASTTWPELTDPEAMEHRAVRALVSTLSELVPPDAVFSPARGGVATAVRLADAMVRSWAATSSEVPGWLSGRLPASLYAPRTAALSRLGRLVASADADQLAGQWLGSLLESSSSLDTDLASAFDLAEATTARTAMDGVAGLLVLPADDAECVSLEREATAYAPGSDHGVVAQQIGLVSALPLGGTPEEEHRRRAVVGRLEERYAALGVGFLGVADPAPLDAVQAQLGPRQLLVRYVLPQHPLHPNYLPHVLVVSADETMLLPIRQPESAESIMTLAVDGRAPWESSPLSNAVVDARVALERGDDPELTAHRLQDLHSLLIAPVLASGLADGRDDWLVVPQRALHHVPWMALHDNAGRWLLDDASITLAPSASVWMHLLGRGDRPIGELLALGNPVVSYAGLPALPGSDAEVRHAGEVWAAGGFTPSVRTGAAATAAALVSGAPTAGLVHLATHGSFPDEAALFDQGFLLSPGLTHSGRVTADQLRRLPLGAAWCVVLSLCNGGAYRVGPGNEPYGLVPALLEAGATSVVAPQWAVEDAVSAELMSTFSDLVLDHGPAEALRRAVLQQRDRRGGSAGDHCGFVVVGTGRGPAGAATDHPALRGHGTR